MKVPYCKKGSRRCPVSQQCIKIKGTRKNRCNRNSIKCANSKCYKKNKSVKSRRNFLKKYFN